jgi:hypothetical protein
MEAVVGPTFAARIHELFQLIDVVVAKIATGEHTINGANVMNG